MVAGMGDSWLGSTTVDGYFPMSPDALYFFVKPKGKQTSIAVDMTGSSGGIFGGFKQPWVDGVSFVNYDYGVFQAVSTTDVLHTTASYEGKCFALPIALVHR